MIRIKRLRHVFVQHLPEQLEDGVLYISIEVGTIAHRCCCGCGLEVVTPLSPTDWKLVYDGESISLYPSIGNWSFPCRSHYWIRQNAISWAPLWSQEEIDAGRKRDRTAKKLQYGEVDDDAFEVSRGFERGTPQINTPLGTDARQPKKKDSN